MDLNELKAQMIFEQKTKNRVIDNLKEEILQAEEDLVYSLIKNMNKNLFYVHTDEVYNTLKVCNSSCQYTVYLEDKELHLFFGDNVKQIISLKNEEVEIFRLIFNKKIQEVELQRHESRLDAINKLIDSL